jgi:hypothetical protein
MSTLGLKFGRVGRVWKGLCKDYLRIYSLRKISYNGRVNPSKLTRQINNWLLPAVILSLFYVLRCFTQCYEKQDTTINLMKSVPCSRRSTSPLYLINLFINIRENVEQVERGTTSTTY